MQTHFSDTALERPEIKMADDILRKCVHCGFCTATCPTFVLTGDERDSPRGRIWMMRDALGGGDTGDQMAMAEVQILHLPHQIVQQIILHFQRLKLLQHKPQITYLSQRMVVHNGTRKLTTKRLQHKRRTC